MSFKIKNLLLNILGMINVIFGIIGIFVPLWPTTIFVIIASICFAKANPKMHAWLLNSRFLGPYLDNYHNKRGIAMAYKIRTCAFMWSGMIFSMLLINLLWVQILVSAIGVAVTTHVFWIKSRKPKEGQFGFGYNMMSVLLVWIWLAAAMLRADTFFQYTLVISLGIAFAIFMLLFSLKRNPKLETTALE